VRSVLGGPFASGGAEAVPLQLFLLQPQQPQCRGPISTDPSSHSPVCRSLRPPWQRHADGCWSSPCPPLVILPQPRCVTRSPGAQGPGAARGRGESWGVRASHARRHSPRPWSPPGQCCASCCSLPAPCHLSQGSRTRAGEPLPAAPVPCPTRRPWLCCAGTPGDVASRILLACVSQETLLL